MDRCYILLLDDDEDDYQLFRAYIDSAFKGKVTLDWFQRDGFSTVMICSGYYAVTFVEYQIGSENGLEVIRRAKETCPEQKMILLTSWDDHVVTEEQAGQAGADQLLRKEALSTELVREILSPYLAPGRCPQLAHP